MRSIFSVLLDILTFGILPLIRKLVIRKSKSESIYIDVNRDGIPDILIEFIQQDDHEEDLKSDREGGDKHGS